MSVKYKPRQTIAGSAALNLFSVPRRRINSRLKNSIRDVLPHNMAQLLAANGDVQSEETRQRLAETSTKSVTSFIGMYLLVAAITSLSWLLGYFEFSFLWVFISIAFLFVVWKAKIRKTIAQHLWNEEATLYRKRAFRQNETAEWFNFLLNRWWVFSSSNIEELVKRRIDERLWDIRPSFVDSLELTTFSMGDQTPNIRNVRTFECSETTPGSLQPISWFNVHRPPDGLDKKTSYQVVVEADVNIKSDDFKMIFRGRVGSSRVNVGFDLVVEDLYLSGTVQAIVHLSMDIPFPHVSKATICFVNKPDVTFNINMLKALSMMEIPLLKSWIHNNVMEGLTKAMVDPASVDIILDKAGPTLMGQSSTKKEKAQGVLTVHLKGSPPKDAAAEDIRYTVLSLGNSKRQTHEVPATEKWDDVCSFFIYNLATAKIKVKHKCKRLITSTTLEQNDVNLSSFPFQVKPFCETTLDSKDGSKTVLKMQYTSLPTIDLTNFSENKEAVASDVSGVMYICIHGASNVLVADKTGASDPYCVLFCDRRRILTTPFIPRTRNPHWESQVEFFVADYTRCSLSFFVYDWDGTNTMNDDFLGSVHHNMCESEPEIIKKSMTLGYNNPGQGFTEDKQCGQITVSVIFRPVPSVARSEKFRDVMQHYKKRAQDYLYREDLMSPSSVAGNPGRKSTTAAYVEELLSDKVMVELTILQGKDLMPMDRNGYSDPYCEVNMNDKKLFTTAVKKKTLFPKWNETVTTEMSLSDAPILSIDVFDKDIISKDFMGKLNLTIEQLKELSIKATSDWFTLDRAKTGKIQLKCNVISKDTVKSMEKEPEDEVFCQPSLEKLNAPTNEITDTSFVSSTENSVTSDSSASPKISAKQHPQITAIKQDFIGVSSMENNNAYGYRSAVSPKFATMPHLRKSAAKQQQSSEDDSSMQRSSSDLAVNKAENHDSGSSQGGSRRSRATDSRFVKRGFMGNRSESTNSVNLLNKSQGDTSSDSASLTTEKMFNVSGKVMRLRGKFPPGTADVYCKVRLDLPGNRLSLFHHSRIIGKSALVPINVPTPALNIAFEIDRGAGVTADAFLIFDMKHSRKEHLATKSYSLRSLLADADGMCKWIPIGNNLELEVSLTQGDPIPNNLRKPGGVLLKSFSFRKDK